MYSQILTISHNEQSFFVVNIFDIFLHRPKYIFVHFKTYFELT